MRLEYFKSPAGNFGDDLNPWLWDRLLPGLLHEGDGDILLGVGTILENWFADRLPLKGRRFVLGAGAGMELPLLKLDSRWHVFGVRGPLTASYLGLSPELAITDPAMCIGTLWESPEGRHDGVGFMPHYQTASDWDWRSECKRLGLIYVDPLAPFEVTLNQISSLSYLLTEAMHGAIVADAFRVPWRALRISPYNYTGKWDDWASTVGLPVHFLPVPHLRKPVIAGGMSRVRQVAKELMGRRTQSPADEVRLARQRLAEAAASDRWYLSDDRRLGLALARFHDGLDRLKRTAATGA